MLQDFTTDPALMKDALRKAKDNALAVRTPISAGADLPPSMLESMPQAMVQQVLRFGQDLITNQMQERVVLTLNEMSALARTLSGYPGRKNLIWVSERWSQEIMPRKTRGYSPLRWDRVKHRKSDFHGTDLSGFSGPAIRANGKQGADPLRH